MVIYFLVSGMGRNVQAQVDFDMLVGRVNRLVISCFFFVISCSFSRKRGMGGGV